MSYLRLTTVRDLDGEPIATVNAQFDVSTHLPHTWLIIAAAADDDPIDSPTAHLDSYGPFATPDDARAWAAAHLTPYSTFTVAPLATPYTDAEANAELRTPIRPSTTAHPARADTITKLLKTYNLPRLRLHRGTRTETSRRGFTAQELDHPELGHVVELIAYGPDDYQRERDHRLMQTVLRHEDPRYEVTDHPPTSWYAVSPPPSSTPAPTGPPPASPPTWPPSPPAHSPRPPAEAAHIPFDAVRQAARGAASETARAVDEPTAAAEAAYTLFDAVLRAAREVASDDPDAHDLMRRVEAMDAPDALAALKKAFLPSDMIEPIADALALLAPHTFTPQEG
ncbi:hypothetical protein AB0G86_44935 [Streptomyces scabiei]|uniref:hypothetical protein n=1 Tax=Streptomyces scabiei TaxID=1930 RepID=UPI0033ECBBED